MKRTKPPQKPYRILYVDPPKEMKLSELMNMELPKIEKNAVLFLWQANLPDLGDNFLIIKAWGFKYKSSFVWDQRYEEEIKKVTNDFNITCRHRILFIATRGSCTPDVHRLYNGLQRPKGTKRGGTPEVFKAIIDYIYTYGNRIELFAKEKYTGWDNDITKQA